MSFVSFLMLFFVTTIVVDSVDRLRWTLLTAIGSVTLASLYVLREWLKYHDVFSDLRPGWVTGDPNYFTVSALACLPLAVCLIRKGQPTWERWFCVGSAALSLMAVTLAASRGGFIGLVAAAVFLLWRSRHLGFRGVVGIALLVLLSFLSPVSPVERLLSPTSSDQDAADSRLIVWKGALRIIATHPIFGIGLGNFKEAVSAYEDPGRTVESLAHNSYLEIAAELGIPGLLVFLCMLLATLRSLERVRNTTRKAGPILISQAAIGIQASLLGSAVAIFFVTAYLQKLLWLMMFVSLCLPALARQADLETSMQSTSRPRASLTPDPLSR
jgi:putative inorganic carbon (HCO3(-)) transporter